MVKEFIEAILEDCQQAEDAVQPAYLTAAGLCAHESAIKGGERFFLLVMSLPDSLVRLLLCALPNHLVNSTLNP